MMVNQERPFGAADDDRPSLREETWQLLVASILHGTCTPVLGAGVSVPHLPRGSELAVALAEEHEYPFADNTNLARVSQYIASTRDTAFLKRSCCSIWKTPEGCRAFLRGNPPDNHLMLARLGLPLYITTNYDDYLQKAIGVVQSGAAVRRDLPVERPAGRNLPNTAKWNRAPDAPRSSTCTAT